MAQEQPAAQTPAPPPSGRSKQFVILILFVLIGQVGIGYWAVYRLLLPKLKAEEPAERTEKAEAVPEIAEKGGGEGGGGHGGGGEKKEGGEKGNPNVHGDLLDLGQVTANTTAGGELHYIILDAKIKFDSNQAAEEAGKNPSHIRDIIQSAILRKPGEELDDAQDQERLREEIKHAINTKIREGKAEEVYFSQYVYQ